MDIQTNLPTENLFKWISSVNYARIVIQQQISKSKKLNLSCNYDKLTVETLTDLEIFLQTAWNDHVSSLEQIIKEVRGHV